MDWPLIIFYCFFGITIASAALIIFTKNVLYAAFSLLITLFGIAAIFVFARADFIAVTQILVYIGGILILIIFGVMLTNKSYGKTVITENHFKFSGFFMGIAMFILLYMAIFTTNINELKWIREAIDNDHIIDNSTLSLIGIKLMSDFVLPFELAAIILLIALIGAAYIAKQQIE